MLTTTERTERLTQLQGERNLALHKTPMCSTGGRTIILGEEQAEKRCTRNSARLGTAFTGTSLGLSFTIIQDPRQHSGKVASMKKTAFAIFLLFCLAAIAQANDRTPPLLLHAAQCLATKNFLHSSRDTSLTLGYYFDEKSYPGEKVIYVVQYASPHRSNGLVFAVFFAHGSGGQVYNIQNNASFILSKDELSGVAFVSPPLGGTWTQQHLALAVRKIEKQPKYPVAVRGLRSVPPSNRCEAYTDPQPKKY